MTLLFVFSLFLISLSVVLHISNDFFAVGGFSILSAILFTVASLKRSTHRRCLSAGLLALAISSVYSSSYLWLVDGEFGLTSDAALYDQIARDIANTVPLHSQINPLDMEYVFDLGNVYGIIKQPGFYKIMGVLYTLADILLISSVSIQVPLLVNLASFALIGYFLYRLIEQVAVSRQIIWVLWLAFMLTPYLLEQLIWLRKDLFTLAVSLLAVNAIYRRSHFFLVAFYIILLATLRLPQAALVMVLYLIYETRVRNLQVGRIFNVNGILLISVIFTLTFVAPAYLPEPEIAPESLAALLYDLPDNIGFSSILLSNAFGVAIYAIIYPFPSLLPQDFTSMANTLFAYLHLLFLAAVIYDLRNMQHYGPFEFAVAITFLCSLAGFTITAIMSWKYLGFVVIEPRYKLFVTVLLLILLARLLLYLRVKKSLKRRIHFLYLCS